MKCFYHPNEVSVQACGNCRRLLCAPCAHSIKGRIFCQDCLVAGADWVALATSPRFANYSPARAAFFALIPGIGAVYNHEYRKALVHFSIFAGLSILGSIGPGIFGLAAFCFYVFTIIDAYRSAQMIVRQQVKKGVAFEGEDLETETIEAPLWGGVLILFIGVLFFLNNLGVDAFRFLRVFWPLVFMGLGVYLIADYLRRSRAGPERVAASNQGEGSAERGSAVVTPSGGEEKRL